MYADDYPGKNDDGGDGNPEGSGNGEKPTEQKDAEPAATEGYNHAYYQEREEVKFLRARPEGGLQASHVSHKSNENTHTKPDKW